MNGFYMRLAAGFLLAILAGCGKSQPEMVALGSAPAERRDAFVQAVAAAMKGYEELEDPKIQVSVSEDDGRPVIIVRGEAMSPKMLERGVSVAVTNIALRYPGVGYMAVDELSFKVLLPDGLAIPACGEFGVGRP